MSTGACQQKVSVPVCMNARVELEPKHYLCLRVIFLRQNDKIGSFKLLVSTCNKSHDPRIDPFCENCSIANYKGFLFLYIVHSRR